MDRNQRINNLIQSIDRIVEDKELTPRKLRKIILEVRNKLQDQISQIEFDVKEKVSKEVKPLRSDIDLIAEELGSVIQLIQAGQFKGEKGDTFTFDDLTQDQIEFLKGEPGERGEDAQIDVEQIIVDIIDRIDLPIDESLREDVDKNTEEIKELTEKTEGIKKDVDRIKSIKTSTGRGGGRNSWIGKGNVDNLKGGDKLVYNQNASGWENQGPLGVDVTYDMSGNITQITKTNGDTVAINRADGDVSSLDYNKLGYTFTKTINRTDGDITSVTVA